MGEHERRRFSAGLRARLVELRRDLGLLLSGHAPRELSRRERLLTDVERIAHLGSWTWNLTTGAISWSEEFYRILGLEPEAVKPSSPAFFAAIHRDDVSHVQEASRRHLEGGVLTAVDFRIVRPSGEIRYVHMEGDFTDGPEGPRSHVLGTVLDETEKRHAAALMAQMVSELNEAQRVAALGSWRLAIEEERIEWSEGMFRLLGISPSARPCQSLFFSHVHPEDVERVRAMSTPAAVGADTQAQIELRIVRSDGAVRDAVLCARGVFDGTGKLTAIHGILQDITERKSLERDARHAQKMEAVGTLAGGVAHDFNNYLMVLGGHLDLLSSSLTDVQSAQRSMDAIRFAYERCGELTEQLLTLSRKRAHRPVRFSLADRIEAVTPMLRSLLGATIELCLSLDRSAPSVYADPAQLEHALINLALNARDGMPEGGTLSLGIEGVCLEQGTQAGLDAGYYVRLSVQDTGVGIPSELQSRIFEPFFTTKAVGKGTGLGLAMVYGIMREAGGGIEVESNPGQGATFHLYLRPALASETEARAARVADVPCGRGQKILLVEDVPLVRELLSDQLQQAGYKLLTAADGVAALRLLADHTVDLLVSDVVMPNMGGRELVRAVQKQYPRLPCLLMSGYNAPSADGQDERAPPLLRKPFTSRQLRAAVAERLASSYCERSAGPNRETELAMPRESLS